MKTIIRNTFILSLFASSMFFASCDNDKTTDADDDNYNKFVTRIEGERDKWDTDTAYWVNVEKEYEPMRTEMDAEYEKADEARRKEIDNIRMRYDKVKGEYMTAREQKMGEAKRLTRENELRTQIWGAEATADLSNVNGTNIRSYYEKLVSTVKANKESYTPSDWDAIKAWYEKLDKMKNDFEGKDLSAKDNLAIAKLKVEFDAIRVPNRIDAKVEEKVNEQENKMDPGKN